jgi:hypothetical protein
VSVSTPPRTGPTAALVAAAMAHAAVARAIDRLGKRVGRDGQALRQHQPGADPLQGPRRQEWRQCRRSSARQRRDGERDQAEPQQCAPAESVAERSGGQQNCGERDVVGIDRPLRTRNVAAQIGADRRQGQVDGVGIDESNEKAQVCRDQRDNR